MKKGLLSFDALLSIFTAVFIAYVASISLYSLRPKYMLHKSLWEVHASLHTARYRAILNNEKIRVRFDSHAYTIDIYDSTLGTWNSEEKHCLEGVTLEANNSPCFHPSGAVSNLASIYIWNSWGKYKITVAITGRVKITEVKKK